MDHYGGNYMSTQNWMQDFTRSEWWQDMTKYKTRTTDGEVMQKVSSVLQVPLDVINAQIHLLMRIVPGNWGADEIMNPQREMLFAGTILRGWSDPQVQKAFYAILKAFGDIAKNGTGYFSPSISGNFSDLLGMVITTVKMMLQSPTVIGYLVNKSMLARLEALHSAIHNTEGHKRWREAQFVADKVWRKPDDTLSKRDEKLWIAASDHQKKRAKDAREKVSKHNTELNRSLSDEARKIYKDESPSEEKDDKISQFVDNHFEQNRYATKDDDDFGWEKSEQYV